MSVYIYVYVCIYMYIYIYICSLWNLKHTLTNYSSPELGLDGFSNLTSWQKGVKVFRLGDGSDENPKP